jgi:hypothetical protein
MAVTSRTEYKNWCLRDLGFPVLEINVDDDQVEDRIDEALEYWHQYHFEGIEEIYMKHQITASSITLASGASAETFAIGEKITGGTSGAIAYVAVELGTANSGTVLKVKNVEGTFANGETITGAETGHNETLAASNAFSLGTYDLQYIEVPDAVYGVTEVLSIGQATSSKNMFDLQYQLRLNDLYDLTATSLIYFKTVMQHLSMLDFEINGKTRYRFNRRQGRLYLDINWATDVVIGEYIIAKTYRALDPTEYSKVWDEPWLKKYGTALIKKQWGSNLKKFSGLQLPGGVTLDGNALYDEAVNEISQLEDQMINKAAPLDFYMG